MTQIDTPYNHAVFMAAIASEALQVLIADMPEEQVAEIISKAASKVMMDILNKRGEEVEAALMVGEAASELIRGLEKVQAVAGRRVV